MSHKIFRDAIHNMIPLNLEVEGDSLLLDLIDTPQMQRLRRIRQLGPACLIYPTAEHSRFSHSLGVMHLTGRILSALSQEGALDLTPMAMLQIKVAALLHDVGHGPFSHVFEHIHPQMPRHEIWSWNIVTGKTHIHRAIVNYCQRLQVDSAIFLEGIRQIWHIPPLTVPHLFGRQLIASQLDADRMDYLLRDAYFTGVAYGRYDLEWLLHSLKVRTIHGEQKLCFDMSKGPTALESYIWARDHMYRQVYDHKTVRAFEVLLIHIFYTLFECHRLEKTFPFGVPLELKIFLESLLISNHLPALDHFLALDDSVLEYTIGHLAALSPQSAIQTLLIWKCRLFRERRPVYRRLLWREKGDGEPSDLILDSEAAQAVIDFFRATRGHLLSIQAPDGSFLEVPLGLLVWVDRLERASYAHLQYTAGQTDPIYVVEASGRVRPAEHVLERIDFLGRSHRRQIRVFVDPLAQEAVIDFIRQKFYHPHILLNVSEK
ncbi:MAG: HD domain-containing protein [Magnetococcus sp. DMHC-6]